MTQVGCGSVGLIRTCCCAKTAVPIKRPKNAGKIKGTRFMFTSLLSGMAATELAPCQVLCALPKTGLSRGKALIPSISFHFWPCGCRRDAARCGLGADAQALAALTPLAPAAANPLLPGRSAVNA